MNKGFNNSANYVTASVDQLRGAVQQRLETAQRRLDPASLRAAFAKSGDPSGQDGLMGSLIFSLMTWMPFMDCLGSAMAGMPGSKDTLDLLNDPTIVALADGVGTLADERNRYSRRPRKVGAYHGGRRQDPIITGGAGNLNKRFNLLASNENSHFAFDAKAEVVCMLDLLNMLDGLEEKGIRLLRLDQKMPVSKILRQATTGKSADRVMRSMPMAVRMAI